MKCPNCKLENLPGAHHCDCGHSFVNRSSLSPGAGGPSGMSRFISGLIRVVWICPLLGAGFSIVNLATNWDAQKSAPQQAAFAGFVTAWTVLPYCFARAVTAILGRSQA
jgi:hypothetical protein